jgi:hypothetical protein
MMDHITSLNAKLIRQVDPSTEGAQAGAISVVLQQQSVCSG